jgi:hypothetical protein
LDRFVTKAAIRRFEILGDKRKPRLESDVALTPADFDAIATRLATKPKRARKVVVVAARVVRDATTLDVVWATEKTKSEAAPGDWIVTNLGRNDRPIKDRNNQINQYVIKTDRFPILYKRIAGETENGPRFQAREESEVVCLAFPGGIDIPAPWGERQSVESGYLLCSGDEVYANEEQSFDDTYQFVE